MLQEPGNATRAYLKFRTMANAQAGMLISYRECMFWTVLELEVMQVYMFFSAAVFYLTLGNLPAWNWISR